MMDGEEIIAHAEAMQAGWTIDVAKAGAISQEKGVERFSTLATATMRAVEFSSQMVDPSRR